jgi:hypothetical protein
MASDSHQPSAANPMVETPTLQANHVIQSGRRGLCTMCGAAGTGGATIARVGAVYHLRSGPQREITVAALCPACIGRLATAAELASGEAVS